MYVSNYLLAGMLVLAVLAVVSLAIAARIYVRYRGKMLLTCPETGKPAAVRVAAGEAALSALLGQQEIHLKECSRWPERHDCGQECLSQLGPDPANCLVWTKVADWYRGQACAYCQRAFGELHWHDHPPALIDGQHKTKQWNEIPAETLPEVFETHLPVCWSCHIAETFRREHPERVVDRPGNRGPMGEWRSSQTEEDKPLNAQRRV